MAKQPIYLRPLFLKIIVGMSLFLGFDTAAAEIIALPGGFRLGSSIDDAKRHAESRGWQLVPLSPELPGSWLVKDQNIGIYVCSDTVAGVQQSSPGDLDDFARLISGLEAERGKPVLQIGSVMAGNMRLSMIDARFAEMEGVNVAVQLSSTDGKLAISTNYSSDKCEEHTGDR